MAILHERPVNTNLQSRTDILLFRLYSYQGMLEDMLQQKSDSYKIPYHSVTINIKSKNIV